MVKSLLTFDQDGERHRRRRQERIAFWARPITGRIGRAHAWAHMLVADHGLFRLFYLNRHKVAEGVWRSAQPAPHQFGRFAAEGIRTIVKLRGGEAHGSWQLQRDACGRFGLRIVELAVSSRTAPSRATILGCRALFDSIEYPAVFHCKAGADRTGLVAALYLLVREGRPVAEAKRQLSWRYGHVSLARSGILGAFLERYRTEGESRGISFLEWAERIYDPAALERDFRPSRWADLVMDRVLRRE